MTPAIFPENLLNIPLPGILGSAVFSINFICLIFNSLFFGSLGLAGLKLPSKLIHLSINAAIKIDILKLLTGVAKIIASALITLSYKILLISSASGVPLG